MNALTTYLTRLIKAQGPLSISTFMSEALGNEKHGYYMKQDPFGKKGDFTTAPEISQMFGELIGLWQAQNWINMGCPSEIHLIELGPGRGTLMQDALRAMKIVPGFSEAINVHMVEMSPSLKKIQKKHLSGYPNVSWHNLISDVFTHTAGDPVLIIANEFFDALPVHQYQKTDTGWHERLIALDHNDELTIQLAPIPSPEYLVPPSLLRADLSSVVEICQVGENILEEISEYISQYSGAALIIDYGHDRHGTGDTLQALKNHKFCDILSEPSNVDLTTHVNFQKLKEIAVKCESKVYGPIGQGGFLRALGIEERSQILLTTATEVQQQEIQTAKRRLIEEEEMGNLFKVMAVTDIELRNVIGFESSL